MWTAAAGRAQGRLSTRQARPTKRPVPERRIRLPVNYGTSVRYVQAAEVLSRPLCQRPAVPDCQSLTYAAPRSWAKELPGHEAIQESASQPEDSPASYLAGGCSTLSSLNRRGVTEVVAPAVGFRPRQPNSASSSRAARGLTSLGRMRPNLVGVAARRVGRLKCRHRDRQRRHACPRPRPRPRRGGRRASVAADCSSTPTGATAAW